MCPGTLMGVVTIVSGVITLLTALWAMEKVRVWGSCRSTGATIEILPVLQP
jgi:hypothetical protein